MGTNVTRGGKFTVLKLMFHPLRIFLELHLCIKLIDGVNFQVMFSKELLHFGCTAVSMMISIQKKVTKQMCSYYTHGCDKLNTKKSLSRATSSMLAV